MHALQHVQSVVAGTAGERRESAPGSVYCARRVDSIGQPHAACHLFGGRIEQVEPFGAVRFDKGAVEVDLVDDLHDEPGDAPVSGGLDDKIGRTDCDD